MRVQHGRSFYQGSWIELTLDPQSLTGYTGRPNITSPHLAIFDPIKMGFDKIWCDILPTNVFHPW